MNGRSASILAKLSPSEKIAAAIAAMDEYAEHALRGRIEKIEMDVCGFSNINRQEYL